MKGIPFADRFNVQLIWDVTGIDQKNGSSCDIKVFLDVEFLKSIPFLQSKIVSDTKQEMTKFIDKWATLAKQAIKKIQR